jgi:hypothetical protein
MSHAVIAKGGLLRLKEMRRDLARSGVEAQVLPPESGCLNS